MAGVSTLPQLGLYIGHFMAQKWTGDGLDFQKTWQAGRHLLLEPSAFTFNDRKVLMATISNCLFLLYTWNVYSQNKTKRRHLEKQLDELLQQLKQLKEEKARP
jgi:hypothetical protein